MKIPTLLKLLLFEESRSVAFGLWLFGVTTWLLVKGYINVDAWQWITGGCTLLVGGRTVVAEYFSKGKKDAPTSHSDEPK